MMLIKHNSSIYLPRVLFNIFFTKVVLPLPTNIKVVIDGDDDDGVMMMIVMMIIVMMMIAMMMIMVMMITITMKVCNMMIDD